MFGEPCDGDSFTFPTPEGLAAVFEDDLRVAKLGFRARYISEFARRVDGGDLHLGRRYIPKLFSPSARRVPSQSRSHLSTSCSSPRPPSVTLSMAATMDGADAYAKRAPKILTG
jgi:hypothetical protein